MKDEPKKYKPRPNSLGYYKRASPGARLADMIPEVISRRPPGIEEKPDKPNPDADPECSICDGYGWRQSRQWKTWWQCSCVTRANRQLLDLLAPKPIEEKIGLTDNELRLLSWQKIIDDPSISDAGRALEPARFLFKRGHGMLFIWGTYGQGKTLLAKILAAEAIRAGRSAAYANIVEVLDQIRGAFDEKFQSTELANRMDWWVKRDVLSLDELSRANMTEWAAERLFILFDNRYTAAIREQALTIMISNKSDGALDGYIRSRLKDRRLWIPIDDVEVPPIIKLNGKDGRQTMPDHYHF